MLSAGFCHLLADSLRQLPFVGPGRGFPLPTFLAGVGFIITLVADQIVHHLTDDIEPDDSGKITPSAVELPIRADTPSSEGSGEEDLPLIHPNNYLTAHQTLSRQPCSPRRMPVVSQQPAVVKLQEQCNPTKQLQQCPVVLPSQHEPVSISNGVWHGANGVPDAAGVHKTGCQYQHEVDMSSHCHDPHVKVGL